VPFTFKVFKNNNDINISTPNALSSVISWHRKWIYWRGIRQKKECNRCMICKLSFVVISNVDGMTRVINKDIIHHSIIVEHIDIDIIEKVTVDVS